MIAIFIDTQQLSDQFALDQNKINNLMDYTVTEITRRFADEWQNEANRTLKSSRQEYISNLNVIDEGFAKGAVVLTGWLPNAVEQGVEGFDIKVGLLEGDNAKLSKKGNRYNTVPFSVGTPTALSENFSGGIMPKEIYEVVKEKPFETETRGGGKATKGLTTQEIPKHLRQPVTKKVIMPKSKDITSYTHKSSIYQGLRKVQDPVTKQNSYQSFRRVSDNSDRASWIHPGIQAVNLSQKVLDNFNIPAETGRIIDRWFVQNF